MTVLFVDFDDVPATQSVDSVFSIINPIAPDFFEETSYGRMQLNLQPHLEWLRFSRSSEYYGTAIYKGHINDSAHDWYQTAPMRPDLLLMDFDAFYISEV